MRKKPTKAKLPKISKFSKFFGRPSAEEQLYFVENLAIQFSSGLGIPAALESIRTEIRNKHFKKAITEMITQIDEGQRLSSVLDKYQLLSSSAVYLIKIGEDSGKLADNLHVIALQMQKEYAFHSKIRSAMIYPAIVISFTLIIGVAVALFLLPRLTAIFISLRIPLPWITRTVISIGEFLQKYGAVVIPLSIILVLIALYVLFINDKTKFIGQALLLTIPGIRSFIQVTEIARFGFVLGGLMETGLPILQTLQSLTEGTSLQRYKKFYEFLTISIEEGNSFKMSFDSYRSKGLFPQPIKQIIVGAEQSGTMPSTLKQIGDLYTEKADLASENLEAVVEPIFLVIVAIGVFLVALSVILPIYTLVGGFSASVTR